MTNLLIKTKASLIVIFLASMLLLTSCSEDDDTPKKQLADIVAVAQANGFNSLAAALTRADLVGTLQGTGPFTVFAPTDEAFANLLSEIGQTNINDVPASVLADILKYHVISGVAVSSSEVTDGPVTTEEGTTVTLSTADGITVNGISVINAYDLEASNGIIHTIDGVLVPEATAQFVNTVLEPAYFSNNFSTLVSAVVKADFTSTLLDTDNLTIFAPNNDAFTFSGINVATTSADDLADVLAYHVLTSKVLSTGIPASSPTFGEDKMYFSLTDNGNYINGNTKLVATDIESGSGVIHEIDGVLSPPTGNIIDAAAGTSDYSSLVAALTRTTTEGETNLIDVLNGEGPFTVFAPTNAAFQALLDSNEAWETLNDIPISTLVSVLSYHVVGARAYDVDLANAVDESNQIETVQGSKLTFDVQNFKINSDVNITDTNINTSNGVIHEIDKILIP